MKTYILEMLITATSPISHNGFERNGNITNVRRIPYVQADGNVEEVPVISGNSLRGKIRDMSVLAMLERLGYGINKETGEVKGLNTHAFDFLFSGGSLESGGAKGLDLDYFREIKNLIPIMGLLGGAAGNSVLSGKLNVNPLIPICNETIDAIRSPLNEAFLNKATLYKAFYLPSKTNSIDFPNIETQLKEMWSERIETKEPLEISVNWNESGCEFNITAPIEMSGAMAWEELYPAFAKDKMIAVKKSRKINSCYALTSEETFNRTDDKKNEQKRELLTSTQKKLGLVDVDTADTIKDAPQQMMYTQEVINAGTVFYWKVVLKDPTDIEYEAFVLALGLLKQNPYIGGQHRIGFGQIRIDEMSQRVLSSDSAIDEIRTEIGETFGQKYLKHIDLNGERIIEFLEKFGQKK
jgi:CRISPR type IV-associated protein Csf2